MLDAQYSNRFKRVRRTIVVLESTVYLGVTAQTWLPLVEELGMKIGSDVEIAYCPERFNPGDQLMASVKWPELSVVPILM